MVDPGFRARNAARGASGPASRLVRGRGTGLNPGNRFETISLTVLGETLDEALADHPAGVRVATVTGEDRTRSVINPVDSPDLRMKWTVNPYRGCEHGCIYCYARPGHEYLGLSCGLDFETRIFAKPEAPALLRRELARPTWKGESIVMSGVTDPYQPVERDLRITRGCLEVMSECNQSVGIITKSALVVRDLDLLAGMARRGLVHVAISITTLDARLASKMEPRTSSPVRRLGAVKALSDAGVPTSVMTAPMIPGLNDREVPGILKAAAAHGARSSGWVMLRLPHQVKELFLEWLGREFPDRASRVESLIRQVRGGELTDPRFGARMRGEGPIAQQIGRLHAVFKRRYGLDRPMPDLRTDLFRRPLKRGQLGLW